MGMLGWVWLLCCALLLGPRSALAYSANAGTMSTVSRSELPVQGQEVLARIEQGGPFAFEKDGVVFGNRERLLPRQKRGHYREYTVPTPGIGHRGARRIVCGGPQPAKPDACYYSADHYASFRLIVR
jgi:ribonuclease T1